MRGKTSHEVSAILAAEENRAVDDNVIEKWKWWDNGTEGNSKDNIEKEKKPDAEQRKEYEEKWTHRNIYGRSAASVFCSR